MKTPLDRTLQSLNDCECCEGSGANLPLEIYNRPGLDAIRYRIGTHASFKEQMLSRLTSSDFPQLQYLKTRDEDDFTIALLDAWAMSLDVLTFYQERIANESFLRTATEQRSVYYLANLIGYKPRPGVAASAYVAFEMETAEGAPLKTDIATGTKIQSIPGPGEKPQLFETVEAIEARPEWNVLRPRLTKPQTVDVEMEQALLNGIAYSFKNGDTIIIVADENGNSMSVNRITNINIDNDKKTTMIDFAETISTPAPFIFQMLPITAYIAAPLTFTNSFVSATVLQTSWNQSNLLAFSTVQGWSINSLANNLTAQMSIISPPGKSGLFSIARQTAVFGHNAPKWQSLPASQRYGEWIIKNAAKEIEFKAAAYPESSNWDSITSAPTLLDESLTKKFLHLDAVYDGIAVGAWVVLRNQTYKRLYKIDDVSEVTRSDYAISAKVTRLKLNKSTDLNLFKIRDTTVYITNALPLELAELPIADTVPASVVDADQTYIAEGEVSNVLLLDHFDLNLLPGQKVILTGENKNLDGVLESEVLTIDEAILNAGFTQLTFKTGLKNVYKRETLSINANVALATHGESKAEVLGSGNGKVPYQKFKLMQPPLTYVSAQTPSGAKATLEIRVNGIQWSETSSFRDHGPLDQVYIVRTNTEGETTVQFGDGISGSRLPTGSENVTAVYRRGMGQQGLVGEKQLSLLMTKPVGVKGVSNPVSATGAEDREARDQARQNAPLTVLTLDRIVSLQDYEDFARAFAGVAKALASWTWDGRRRGVFITVAGPDGVAIDDTGTTHENLIAAIRQSSDPLIPIWVKSYRPAFFLVEGSIKVDDRYQTDDVLEQAKTVLRDKFNFKVRQFGQAVSKSEVFAAIQKVDGVVAVNITRLHRIDNEAELIAKTPQPGANNSAANNSLAAELLLLDPRPIALELML